MLPCSLHYFPKLVRDIVRPRGSLLLDANGVNELIKETVGTNFDRIPELTLTVIKFVIS
jgi:hypothetical protein